MIWDGDSNCEHEWSFEEVKDPMNRGGTGDHEKGGISKTWDTSQITLQGFCSKCGAWFGQLGLEPSPELYLQHLKQVMIELKRVLKPSGTIWWNMGDTYGGSTQKFGVKNPNYVPTGFQDVRKQDYYPTHKEKPPQAKIMPKCLLMLPERFAWICISELGLILRNKICWYKPNHLPSSAKDRFTNTWEYIFLFSKSRKYFFNLDAVRMPFKDLTIKRVEQWIRNDEDHKDFSKLKPSAGNPNPQYVLQRLVHKLVKEVKASKEKMKKYDNNKQLIWAGLGFDNTYDEAMLKEDIKPSYIPQHPLGKNPGDLWEINIQPFFEAHFAVFPEELVRRAIKCGCPKNGVVLDPFVGSGTTLKVAIEQRRNAIGIEIIKDYCKITMKRCNLPNPFVDFELKVINTQIFLP